MKSQNGYTVLTSDTDPALHEWIIPGCERTFPLLHGAPGFLLANWLLWFHTEIEPLDSGSRDDWGWGYRPISGSGGVMSNHSSGTAVDTNAALHPFGVRNTFTASDAGKIRRRILLYGGCLRWGGDYRSRADDMHVEINASPETVAKVAKAHLLLPRGRRITKANSSQTVLLRR